MSNTRYAIIYAGNGLVRLPRAGVFQTGTRAVVDEIVARIAVAHGSFNVEALGPDTAGLATVLPTAVAPAPAPAPAAAPEPRKSRAHRASAAVRVPARSEATAATDPKAADAHTR